MANDLLSELKQSKPYGSPAQEAHIAIVRTAALLTHAFEEVLKPFGITSTQYNVLRILRGAGPGGWCRSEIRDRMVTLVPDVTRLLDRLEDLGYVTRSRGVDDRRHVSTQITKRGLELLDRVESTVMAFHDEQLGHLTPRQLQELTALLAAVRQPRTDAGRSSGAGDSGR